MSQSKSRESGAHMTQITSYTTDMALETELAAYRAKLPELMDREGKFVLIHGGWPFSAESVPLLSKPNAWVDFSEQTAFTSPRSVATVLRAWLEYNPEKVLFATDAYGFSDAPGWEEATYANAKAGREALGLALTGMVRDDDISMDRARQLAHMVLRDNARTLYGLK